MKGNLTLLSRDGFSVRYIETNEHYPYASSNAHKSVSKQYIPCRTCALKSAS